MMKQQYAIEWPAVAVVALSYVVARVRIRERGLHCLSPSRKRQTFCFNRDSEFGAEEATFSHLGLPS